MLRPGTCLSVFAVLVLAACGESKKPPSSWPDGLLQPDGQVFLDVQISDVGAPPDFKNDPGGPVIKVTSPHENELVVGDVLKVQAEITDSDGVKDDSITVQLGSASPVKLSVTTTPNLYEAVLDISQVKNKASLVVMAEDLVGKRSGVYVLFERDPGPTLIFVSPTDKGRYRGSVSVQALLSDPRGIASFEARIGTYKVPLSLTTPAADTKKQIWVGSVKFDDPAFNPALSGQQVLTGVAVNTNKAQSTAQRVFFVDDQGPSIVVESHVPGQLIGGIIQLKATVTDLAGVLGSTVKCVIGNNLDTRTVPLKNSTTAPDTYVGQFDTRTLSQYFLWPVMSFRAADQLGNESHVDIQVGLDNGPPIISLDPSTSFHYMKKDKDGNWQCSRPFDPLGPDAVNDGQSAPQISQIRARIEDQGNNVLSAVWVPDATIDNSTPFMYVLDDSTKALVVDTDGDGDCDDINPEVIPVGSTPLPGQAVAVGLAPIPVGGAADFEPKAGNPPLPCLLWGDDTKPPGALCKVTPLTVAIYYDASKLPAIYSVPPTVGGYSCVGLPFDFKANNISEGWVCVAVAAADKLGNRGVSKPLRLNVDFKLAYPVAGPGGAPDCTGTLNKASGKVDSSKPCKFRDVTAYYPQVFPQIEVREIP